MLDTAIFQDFVLMYSAAAAVNLWIATSYFPAMNIATANRLKAINNGNAPFTRKEMNLVVAASAVIGALVWPFTMRNYRCGGRIYKMQKSYERLTGDL